MKQTLLNTREGILELLAEVGAVSVVRLTQDEYDALEVKDANTLYVIEEGE